MDNAFLKFILTLIILLSSTPIHAVFWNTDGKIDGAVQFSDVGKVLNTKDNWNLFQAHSLPGDFTISFWASVNSARNTVVIEGYVPITDWSNIIQNIVLGPTGNQGTNISLDKDKIRFYENSNPVLVANTDFPKDTWFHVFFTRSGNNIKIYLDSNEVGNTTWTGNFAFSQIGGTTIHGLVGRLDDIRIYSRELSTQERAEIIASNLSGNSLSNGLIHHFPLDDVREFYNRDAMSDKFPFSSHWFGITGYVPAVIGGHAIGDFDKDGDLDFASGRLREHEGAVNEAFKNTMFWYEYIGPDNWIKHLVGSDHNGVAGGETMDVNQDGWLDLTTGDYWWENPKATNRDQDSNWIKHQSFFNSRSEEVSIGDVDGDSVPELLHLMAGLVVYKVGSDPSGPATVLLDNVGNGPWQGGFFADFDGDNDNDFMWGKNKWFENVNGDGTVWRETPLYTNNSEMSNNLLSHVGDLDGDGDVDIAVAEHWQGRIGWIENLNKGQQWAFHSLPKVYRDLHSAGIADFDNDGDLDIYFGENIGNNYIWENTDGKGTFVEHVTGFVSRAHTTRFGDVDCDGDLDLVGNSWVGGNHVYFKNLIVERGGQPKWMNEREPYETGPLLPGQVDCRQLLPISITPTLYSFELGYTWAKESGLKKTLLLTGHLQIGSKLSIFNSLGQMLKIEKINTQPPYPFSFSTEGSGPWILKVEDKGKVRTVKLIR